MGTGTSMPKHSILYLSPNIRTVRSRTNNGRLFTAMDVLDMKRTPLSKVKVYNAGQWYEYKLNEGEVITGVFGKVIPGNVFKNIGFIL